MASLPDLLILGPPRTGTTALYHYLCSHPDVEDARRDTYEIETRYFTKYHHKGLDWYKEFFTEDKFSLEATTQYSYNPPVPKLVQNDLPKVKLIQLQRNRVDRAWSHFCMHRKNTDYVQGRPLEEYVCTQRGKYIIENSVYLPQVKRWLEDFDKNQLLLVQSEYLWGRTDGVYQRILHFLGLPEFHKENYQVINDIEKPPIPANTKEFLQQRYEGCQQKLIEYVQDQHLNYVGRDYVALPYNRNRQVRNQEFDQTD